MHAIQLHKMLEQDGRLLLTELPFRKGQAIDLILLGDLPAKTPKPLLTADVLLQSEIVGLWKDRQDIGDSTEYARQLREQAQQRRR